MHLPIFDSDPKCQSCDLHRCTLPSGHNGTPSLCLSFDPALQPLVFIGMNPGREECLQNEPFVGPSGRIVRSVFLPFLPFATVASIYLSNTARCYSPVTPTGNTIEAKHYRACAPLHLLPDLQKIASLHPNQTLNLLLLGAETTKHVSSAILSSCRTSFYSSFATPEHKPVDGKPQPHSPKSKRKLPPLPPELAKPIFPRLSDAFKAQGRTLRWNSISVRFFATFHPAAILRDRKLILSTEDHLRMIYSVLSGHSAPISTPNLIPPRILK